MEANEGFTQEKGGGGMKNVRDESELPAPQMGGQSIRYLRSLCDPRVYIAGNSGECFSRTDGLMWEHPGYAVHEASRTSASAYGDFHQYPYAKQQVAA
jgi:hypothetical protein